MRSFLNGKIDLVQAESVAAIVNAKSLAAATLATKFYLEASPKAIEKIRNDLILLVSNIEYEIDISEEKNKEKPLIV